MKNPLLLITFCLCFFFTDEIVKANTENAFFDINGFVETRIGTRIKNDPHQKDMSIGELRAQLETEKDFEEVIFTLVTDMVIDPVLDSYTPDLESGEGIIDLRQFNILFSPTDNTDVKLGRQILTWGTGDLLFINDLFAKDFNSFFIGRDDEYLKAPTDAIKVSIFSDKINTDLIYVPKFNADRYIDGKRISYFEPVSRRFKGRDNPVEVDTPKQWFDGDELTLRLYGTIDNMEAAVYYYHGFWKSPAGMDTQSGKSTFPKLQVLGASLRTPLFKGITSLEAGYYKSDQAAQSDPLSNNSEFRLLIGHQKEIAKEFTLTIQYQLIHKLNYTDYLTHLPENAIKQEINHNTITLRLTKLMLQQNLTLSFFNFYSPSDEDRYLRLQSHYKITDDLKSTVGLNYFYGDEPHTFYSQFENASNVYTAIRYEY